MRRVKRLLLVSIIASFVFYTNSHIYGQVEQDLIDFKKKSYFEAGVTFGTPAFLNAVAGYSTGPIVFHISGMYLGDSTNGFQINAAYKLKDNSKIRHTIGLAFAKSQDVGTNYYILGPAYELNYKKFYLETGLGRVVHVMRGEFDTPYWIFFQIGYVYRFLPK